MKKQITFLLFFSCFFLSGYAQKYSPATLCFADGKTSKVLLKYTLTTKDFVVVKAAKKAKKQKIQCDLLKQIIYDVPQGEPVIFERPALWTGKKVLTKQWVRIFISGPVTLYGQDSRMIMGHLNYRGDMTYFARRTNDEQASYLGVDFAQGIVGIGVNKHFRKYAAEYFSDYSKLVQQIEDEEFGISDIVLVVQEYNKWAKMK